MSWLLLVASIVLEVLGTVSMKLSEGFSRPLYSALVALFYALSIAGLALVLKGIEVSVAYAVWSGLGTAFIAMVGVIVFGEALSVGQGRRSGPHRGGGGDAQYAQPDALEEPYSLNVGEGKFSEVRGAHDD